MTADSAGEGATGADRPAGIEELFADLNDLSADVDRDTRREISETKALLAEAHERGLLDSDLRHLGADDAVEAFVGSVVFASPLLVEDGVFDIAAHLFGVTVAGVPVFLIANVLFVVVLTYALIELTGRDREETHTVLGIPVRLAMILVVSFLVAAVLMTVWGRAGDWRPPSEALARVSVLWTVGSLGAALGDILADGDSSPVVTASGEPAGAPRESGGRPSPPEDLPAEDLPAGNGAATDGASVADPATPPELAGEGSLDDGALLAAIHERFDDIHDAVEGEVRRDVRRVRDRTGTALVADAFDEGIRKYTSRDIAEAFVGSVFFSIPFLVEDGVFDVAAYFLSFRLGGFPVFFLVNAAFVLAMIWVLVYWAGPREVAVSRPLFGIIPRRMVGISAVSFLTAAALMTMWGRIAWADPVVAIARVSVVWSVASFGAALGDVLPGESSGDDINDDFDQLGDRVGDLIN